MKLSPIMIFAMLTIGITAIACETQAPPAKSEITSFEECADAGNAVMESYPRQCIANGKTFIEELMDDELSKTIPTRAGDLSLEYRDGTVSLSGILQRSTPCVNWAVKMVSTKDLPISEVKIDIFDSSTGEICVQVLGDPQEIKETLTQVSKNTKYTVKFEEAEVFSGKLDY